MVECGIDPSYFLDRMQWYEVEAAISGLAKKDRTSWEQTRMGCYFTAQVNSKKKLSPTDIMPFEWDCQSGVKPNTAITNEEIERLKKKAQETLKTLRNG